MSRAQAMAQRAREAEGEAVDPAKPGWFKLLLVAGGIGIAAAWITSPTRRAREDRDLDERDHDERGERSDREDRDRDDRRGRYRDDDHDRDADRRSETCACGRSLTDGRRRDEHRDCRGREDRE